MIKLHRFYQNSEKNRGFNTRQVPKNQKQSQSQQAVDTPLPPQLRNCQSLWEFGIIPKEHVKRERERACRV